MDRDFEKRVIAWAVSCRDGHRVVKCATEVFCESLPYVYGEAEPLKDENGDVIQVSTSSAPLDHIKIDRRDCALLDSAFRDPRMPQSMRDVIRFRYCYGMSAKRVELKCHLPRKTFDFNVDLALTLFQKICREKEEKLDFRPDFR